MKANRNWKTIAGWVLHGLIGGIMILAGSAKVFGLFPPDLGGGVPARPGDVRQFCWLLADRTTDRERQEGPRGLTARGWQSEHRPSPRSQRCSPRPSKCFLS